MAEEEGGGVREGADVEVERVGEEERFHFPVLLLQEGLERLAFVLEEAAT